MPQPLINEFQLDPAINTTGVQICSLGMFSSSIFGEVQTYSGGNIQRRPNWDVVVSDEFNIYQPVYPSQIRVPDTGNYAYANIRCQLSTVHGLVVDTTTVAWEVAQYRQSLGYAITVAYNQRQVNTYNNTVMLTSGPVEIDNGDIFYINLWSYNSLSTYSTHNRSTFTAEFFNS